jgi:DNA-binding response OmpR family regulator
MAEKEVKILLAEDDHNLGTILKAYLEAKGFPAKLYINGKEALEAFMKEKFDFCILDVMMPVKDGFTLAREIRKTDKKIPILFLTAKSMQEDRIEGLQLGADDYLTKPFSMEELLLRIKAILRRAVSQTSSDLTTIKLGVYTFDYTHQTLANKDNIQKLTSKEAELLKLLCERLNDVLDRSIALNRIWNDDSYFNARSMDVYIAKLRKYLKDDPGIELLNVHGIGFKLLSK